MPLEINHIPDFIGRIEGPKRVGRGTWVLVTSFTKLPAEIRNVLKKRRKLVVKEYDPSALGGAEDSRIIFRRLLNKALSSYTPSDKPDDEEQPTDQGMGQGGTRFKTDAGWLAFERARELRDRQQYVKGCFLQLPRFVIQSQFVVGDSTLHPGIPTVYELQPKITGAGLDKYWGSKEDMHTLFFKFSRQEIKRLLSEMILLKQAYEAMKEREDGHWYLDLEGTGKNILVVENGGLRCVDTNVIYPYRRNSRHAAKFKRDLNNLTTFIDRLQQYSDSL